MPSRKRRPNWTDEECLFLAQLMEERKTIIRGNSRTGVSTYDKRLAWEEIVQTINTAFPQFQRTVSDCNKKWDNLQAKTREEIKQQKRQAGTEGLSLEQFSTVTQIVISVMNLSGMLQQDRTEDSSISELVETQQNSCNEDGNDHTMDEKCSNKHLQTELDFPTYPDQSTSPAEQKCTLTDVPLVVQVSTLHTAGFTTEPEDTACSTSPSSEHCATSQERKDLEIAVLRRQEAVLKLQEEYYTLKIKLMKKQIEEETLS